MLKHIVMWDISDEIDNKEEIAYKIKEKLEILNDLIDELKFIEVGVNTNPSEAAKDLVLYSEFIDENHLNRYQNHPEHLKVVEFIKKHVASRVVVDYKV
ncbi:Dabb family protein [Iocasia frigidifontis]|uniref:Dabb family protein n=1 Tax=Iocasia fonsfrigidae TaxID=2682810 RepID=A0A8A7KK23_9FIRM|nr:MULTISPECIES: Dabb family protein [Halanaerobiaceae]AZO95597.1 Dabb family protein [Halocella sp. SP3-1]QTL98464.1 Dabb family protein [Iocasia fonsfrigidae]